MNRIDRLTAILIHLQTKKVVKAQEMADRFGISLRTVYRDVRALEEAGVPIGAEAGIGYFLQEGYHLPPVMFSKEEAAALLTGEKLIEKLGDKSVGRHFSDAMRKIRAVLRNTEKEYLEALDQGMVVHRLALPEKEVFPNHFLSRVQEGIAGHRVLEMEYFASYKEETSKRRVEPIGIFYQFNHWHLIAWCRLRKAYRDFRVDRIKSLRVLDEAFPTRERTTLQEYLQKFRRPKELLKVVLALKPEVFRFLGEQKYSYGLVEEIHQGDRVQMTFLCHCLEHFSRWLLVWGDAVEVLEPTELTDRMQRLTRELFEHYQKMYAY